MKKLFLAAILTITLFSCAEPKTFKINGKNQEVKPYGWANSDADKNDSVVYQICVGNVVWDIIASETIVAPVILTGYQFYEPVRKKTK